MLNLTQPEVLLQELVLALRTSYISSWQSTAGWDRELNNAESYLEWLQEKQDAKEQK